MYVCAYVCMHVCCRLKLCLFFSELCQLGESDDNESAAAVEKGGDGAGEEEEEVGCFIFLAGFSCDLADELTKLLAPNQSLPLLLNAHPLDTSSLYSGDDLPAVVTTWVQIVLKLLSWMMMGRSDLIHFMQSSWASNFSSDHHSFGTAMIGRTSPSISTYYLLLQLLWDLLLLLPLLHNPTHGSVRSDSVFTNLVHLGPSFCQWWWDLYSRSCLSVPMPAFLFSLFKN